MVDSRDKGARAETSVRDFLRLHTKLQWERVPGSGALDPKHGLKGDLYVPNANNLWCIEVKHYADSHLNYTLLTGKNPQLIEWWEQTLRQADQLNKEPLLIFKHDRSKLFAAWRDFPSTEFPFIFINREPHSFYVGLLEDFLKEMKPKFIL